MSPRALAAVAMHEPSGRRFEITGPKALDMPTVADRHRTATGGMLRYVDITPRQHRAAMARDGTDPWWAYAFDTMFSSIREQRWAAVSDDFRELTGQAPTPYRRR